MRLEAVCLNRRKERHAIVNAGARRGSGMLQRQSGLDPDRIGEARSLAGSGSGRSRCPALCSSCFEPRGPARKYNLLRRAAEEMVTRSTLGQ